MESAQYLYTDISTMNNFFNWTMTYRKDSDFYRPYGRVVQVGRLQVAQLLYNQGISVLPSNKDLQKGLRLLQVPWNSGSGRKLSGSAATL